MIPDASFNATGSKDKRLTMLPDQIKRFIIDCNSVRVKPENRDSQLAGGQKNINVEAFNAYYEQKAVAVNAEGQLINAEGQIINNIMHINSHNGANINITTGQNCMNNFIFNHTAPINLNFYKDGQQKGEAGKDQIEAEDKNVD